MQKTISNVEFYAPDNFHSWGAPPNTQKNGLCRPIGQRAVKYRSEVMESYNTDWIRVLYGTSLATVVPMLGLWTKLRRANVTWQR